MCFRLLSQVQTSNTNLIRVYWLMVKTGQFTTKCKGNRVIALKRQNITLVELHLEC